MPDGPMILVVVVVAGMILTIFAAWLVDCRAVPCEVHLGSTVIRGLVYVRGFTVEVVKGSRFLLEVPKRRVLKVIIVADTVNTRRKDESR